MDKETFTLKLHECCSDDDLRPIMNCVHFKGGYAYASDAHIVIKQSLEYHTIINPELLDGKSLHKDNFKAVMGFERAECDDAGIACTDHDGRAAFFEYFDRKDQEMPDFDKVLTPKGYKSVEQIGISPEYITMLAKAMHSPNRIFRLRFQGMEGGILIDVPEIPHQWALLSVVILNETLFG
jgi:hypothetical protein